jgi:glucose-6-phosphate 1-dehydrogenase
MADATAIVIFGASGDLAQRKLGPALHSLACSGQLPSTTQVIGVGRTVLSDSGFRERLFQGVQRYARLKPDTALCDLWPSFADRFSYLTGDPGDPRTYSRLSQRLVAGSQHTDPINVLTYLAVPPHAVPTIIRGVAEAGLQRSADGWRRIVFEKPFGVDRASAHALNRTIHGLFSEPKVFRIDHYLGKETVQNILTLRFANAVFEPLWCRDHVDHLQITLAEKDGVGHRAGYYDRTGVIRDILQNHGLQLVALAMMEPPESLEADALRDAKIKLLQAIRTPSAEDAVLGQYKGYGDEPGVAGSSRTPTYAAVRLHVDSWRWRGVPVYIRSGKYLPVKTTQITLQFKPPKAALPLTSPIQPNRLMLQLEPNEGMHLQVETKLPGAGLETRPTDLVFHYADHFGAQALPDAYERLLLDALQGDPSLFLRDDEIEACWSVVEPLLRLHEHPGYRVAPYPDGSWGPNEADALLEADGRAWLSECTRTHVDR